MSNKEKLFTEFQSPSKQEWLDKIQVDLKGADFEKKLVWRTNEGFNMQPFYLREDIEGLATPNALPGEFPFVRGNKKDNNVWRVRQNIVVDDAKVIVFSVFAKNISRKRIIIREKFKKSLFLRKLLHKN